MNSNLPKFKTIYKIKSNEFHHIEKGNYLSAPLTFQASAGVDGAIPPAHQGLEAIDLAVIVDVDFEVEVGPVSPMGPQEISTIGDMDGAP